MTATLLRVLRIVIRADSDPARQTLFANLIEARLSVRIAYRLHQRLGKTWLAALPGAAYGLACLPSIAPPRNRRARVVSVAKHENARRQVERVVSWVGPAECGSVRSGPRVVFGSAGLQVLAALMRPGRLWKAFRIIRLIDTRHGLLVSSRAAGAIAWYARGKAILAAYRPGVVLVSSDSNPEEVGFTEAARALDIPRVFISHAYPTPFSPPLDFSLSILEGEAAVNARRRLGPIKGQILLAGIEGESVPLDPQRFTRPNPVIGVFTPKAVSWPTLSAVVDDCRRHFGARLIVIRWHPSMFEKPRLAVSVADLSGVVVSPRWATLPDVARQCDWVVAYENSNVHLPVLKLGIPTIPVRNLGRYPEERADQYGFIAGGIVLPPVRSIRDVQPEALVRFFNECWSARFQEYDAAYLRPQDAIGPVVRRAIWELLR